LLPLFLLACFFPVSLPAQSQQPQSHPSPDHPSSLYNLAVQAFNREDYKEALSQIQQAISEAPESLEYQYVLGRCYLRMHRLEEAETIFLALLRGDEAVFRKAYFDEANILVQLGKEDEALRVIEKGRPSDPPRADYETGIIYMRQKKYTEAVGPLGRAALARPELASQAMTQQAIAEFHLKHFKESKSLLKRVLEMDLPPQKAQEIRNMLRTVDAAIEATKPWEVEGSAGFQYDDNVFQTPLQQANFQRIRRIDDDKDDVGFISSLMGKYRVLEDGPWRMGVAYNHYSVVYVDHGDLDAVGARPSAFVQWDKTPYLGELQVAYSHYWVGGDSWLNAPAILPRFSMQHGDRWRTDIAGGTEWHLYQDETPNDTMYFLGATERYLLRDGKAHIRAGYLMSYDNLVPEERADYRSHAVMLGIQWPVWRDEWFIDVSGRYIRRDFDFDPLFSTEKDRVDDEKDVGLLLYGHLTPSLLMSFQFQHIWNDSNIPNPPDTEFFSYRRAVYTLMLTYNY
jgi:tetratricopeptide (TPR) repeat protein